MITNVLPRFYETQRIDDLCSAVDYYLD